MTASRGPDSGLLHSGLLHSGLERAAAAAGSTVAVLSGDDAWTWADLDGGANAVARHLGGRGVTAGDRVAVALSNRVEFVLVVAAVAKLGASSVLISPAWKAAEAGHALELTGPRVGVADGASAAVLADLLGAGSVVDLDDDAARAAASTSS